ncbi:MAG: hypothetical protein HQ462_06230 [Deltaproteobacteria bacterium]|nr:hypothetical protein [Deltaproteobacteria bacterium]
MLLTIESRSVIDLFNGDSKNIIESWTLAAEYRTWFMLNSDSELPNIINHLKVAWRGEISCSRHSLE